MDTRTGQIYPDMESGKAAGVPDDCMVPVTVSTNFLTIESGPFKGRIYDVVDGKRGRRREDLEARAKKARELEAQIVALSGGGGTPAEETPR